MSEFVDEEQYSDDDFGCDEFDCDLLIEDGSQCYYPPKIDPEFFEYKCLTLDEAMKLLDEWVEQLATILGIPSPQAKVLLRNYQWYNQILIDQYLEKPREVLLAASLLPSVGVTANRQAPNNTDKKRICNVCTSKVPCHKFYSLTCSHAFCKICWGTFFESQISQGISLDICCMAPDCGLRAPTDLVLSMVKNEFKDKLQRFVFQECVNSHPKLSFCPGRGCQMIVHAISDDAPKLVVCSACNTNFCFKCTQDYHAPLNCKQLQEWLARLAEDFETLNYLLENTKPCPQCGVYIQKNGGCNHMRCAKCHHDFCWMCMADFRNHNQCSRYVQNTHGPSKRFLHYYSRWKNHERSLQLEKHAIDRVRDGINKNDKGGDNVFVNWDHHLFKAVDLLAKCRITLKFTYPYAYYLEEGPRKDLFEYQQAEMEKEIENLSWKIEYSAISDATDMENQMQIAEHRRTTLLQEFSPE